ncbi:MAG: efflux RND transporter periplasmic adaptor subunit [Myxococcaceae bacterium]|nr:efflux RND transporter periplasmic adaptor subunit [Myxococcaceae bacterium]
MFRPVTLLLLLVACSEGKAPPKTKPAPLVTTAKVATEDVPVLVRGPVDIRPVAQADLGSKTVGYLDAVLVDRGDVVKKGQVLALVRPSELPDQLAAARNTVAQAEAARTLAKTNLERAQKLAPNGLVSQQDLANATNAAAAAEAQFGAAQSQLGALGVRLGETRLEAPYDGVVITRRLDPGALIGPATPPALTIAKIDVVRAFLAATEDQAIHLQVGQTARVFVAGSAEPVTGRVQRIAPGFDPVTRTLDAEIHLPNSDGRLRPGMYGKGEIETEVKPGAVVVPLEAVQLANDKAFVFVVKGETVQRVPIELGEDLGDRLEAKKGLEAGAEIVVRGIDALADGAKIRTAQRPQGAEQHSGPREAGSNKAGGNKDGGGTAAANR